MLGELAELSLVVARELAVRLRESEDTDETVALAGAFQKMSRVVRLTLALDAKLERDAARDAAAEAQAAALTDAEAARVADCIRREEARVARAAEPVDPIEARKSRVRSLMNRLLWTESEGEEEDYEVLVEDLNARLDEAARSPDFEDFSIEALARRVIADMGLTSHFALSLAEPKPAPERLPQPADTG
ncbi:MAG: hypothetical protein JWR10_1553 [Rubritepida sp.]|nr:hypothetical protein [Rubritepida sp.]